MKIDDKNIDELLMAYLLNELDDNSVAQVEQWISASDENGAKFEQIQKIWQSAELSNLHFDTESAWNKVSDKIEKKSIFIKNWISIAATIILLTGSYFVFQYINKPLETTTLYANNSFTNDTLIDGSVIILNENSQISYNSDFNKNKREITLKGEAFFDIERDTSKTFIINTTNSRVEVLGTSFNINSEPTDSLLTVFVNSGSVLFSYQPEDTTMAYQEVRLSAGEKVTYNKNRGKVIVSSDSDLNQTDTYWIDNKLSFDGITLGKVVQILEIIYDVKIVLFNSELSNCRLTVSFDNNDIDQILEVIATTFNLELEQNKSTYILKGNACENK